VKASQEESEFGERAADVSAAVHSMIAGGEVLADVGGVCVGALRDERGECFGALASGGDGGRPPAVPAEFVRLMMTKLGPLLESAWKVLKLNTLADTTQFWLNGVCEDNLDGVDWQLAAAAGEPPPAGDHVLSVTDGAGNRLGSLIVRVKAGATLNKFMVEMLAVTADLLQQAADDVLGLGMGDGVPEWLPAGIKDLNGRVGRMAAKMAIPGKLMRYAATLIGGLSKDAISEIKSYGSPPEAVVRVMQSVMLLLDRAKFHKDVPEWKDVRGKVDMDLVKDCAAFDASLKGHKRQWVECRKASKGLTSDEVLKKGSAAVQIFQKWVEVQRLVRHIAQEMRKEAKVDAEADDGDQEEEEEEEEE